MLLKWIFGGKQYGIVFSPDTETGNATPVAAEPDALALATSTSEDMNEPTTDAPEPEAAPTTEPTEPESMADAVAAAFDAPDFPDKGDAEAEGSADDKPAEAEAEGAKDPATDKSDPTERKPDTPEADTPLDDPTPEELSAMHGKTRQRVKQLLGERDTARQEASATKDDAQGYRTIRQFMTENQLEDSEVGELFKLGADLKSGDPARLKAFLQRMEPLVEMAREATGQALPKDLQTQVEDGEMSEAAALRLAEAQYRANLAEARGQQTQQARTTETVERTRATIRDQVQNWHTQTAATDPEFALKTDMMKRVAQAIVAERGHPPTPDLAVQYAKEAYSEATKILRSVRPQPKATRPTPTPGLTSASRTGAKPAPTTLEEAMGQAFDTLPS